MPAKLQGLPLSIFSIVGATVCFSVGHSVASLYLRHSLLFIDQRALLENEIPVDLHFDTRIHQFRDCTYGKIQ